MASHRSSSRTRRDSADGARAQLTNSLLVLPIRRHPDAVVAMFAATHVVTRISTGKLLARVWICYGDYKPAVKLSAGSPTGRQGPAVLNSTPPLGQSGPQKVTVAIQTDMQLAPQPHGPAVCMLEDEDLDQRIPKVWGFQLCDSVTTQSLTESNPSTSLVNFTPLSEDRGLSSYPLQRPSSPRLIVSGPSAAVSAASDPASSTVLLRLAPVPFVVLLPVPVLLQSLFPAPALLVSITSVPVPLVSPPPAPMPLLSSLPIPVSAALRYPVPAPPTPL